jgi:RNA polymerase sigma factor (sigma-70 family)
MDLFPVTRWSLIARLPDQPQQVATLIALYADAVGAYVARRLAGERPERVADIVQEVLLDLLTRPEVLARAAPGEGSRFRYYLMDLAWSSARNALRRARTHDRGGAAMTTDLPAPEHALMDRVWATSVIQAAFDTVRAQAAAGALDPEALAIMTENLVEGRGLRDIASERGWSLATCQRRCATARCALQEAMCERLRLAGELGTDEDPAAACALLLRAAAQG